MISFKFWDIFIFLVGGGGCLNICRLKQIIVNYTQCWLIMKLNRKTRIVSMRMLGWSISLCVFLGGVFLGGGGGWSWLSRDKQIIVELYTLLIHIFLEQHFLYIYMYISKINKLYTRWSFYSTFLLWSGELYYIPYIECPVGGVTCTLYFVVPKDQSYSNRNPVSCHFTIFSMFIILNSIMRLCIQSWRLQASLRKLIYICKVLYYSLLVSLLYM